MQKSSSPTRTNGFNSVVPKPFDPNTLSQFRTIDSLLTGATEVVYSEKLDEIIVSGFMRRDENFQIRVYDGKTFALKAEKEAHKMPIHKLMLLPEELLATVSVDKTVKIWRLIGLEVVHQFKLQYEPLDLCVNSALLAAIIVGKSPKISCYDIKTGSLMAEVSGASAEGYNTCVFLKDLNVLVAGLITSYSAHVIDCMSSTVIATIEGSKTLNPTNGIQLVEPNQVVLSSDNTITTWDLSDPKNPKQLVQISSPVTKINHFYAIPEEDIILFTHNGPSLYFHRYNDGTFVKAVPTKLHKCRSIKHVKTTDRILVTDSEEGNVGIFVKKEKSSKNACAGCAIF